MNIKLDAEHKLAVLDDGAIKIFRKDGSVIALTQEGAQKLSSALIKALSPKGSETITITFKGSKKFKQALVDAIFELLMDDGLVEAATKPGCGFDFSTSIVPSGVQ